MILWSDFNKLCVCLRWRIDMRRSNEMDWIICFRMHIWYMKGKNPFFWIKCTEHTRIYYYEINLINRTRLFNYSH